MSDGITRCQIENQTDLDVETQPCNEFFCNDWGKWTSENCSGDCGGSGFYKAYRSCRHTLSISLSEMPDGCYQQSLTCVPTCNFEWGEWSEWSACSHSCSPGTRTRNRKCFFNSSAVELSKCNGGENKAEDIANCNEMLCQRWSEWSAKTCRAQCEEDGIQPWSRNCLDPAADMSEKCNVKYSTCRGERCIGYWTDWNSWSDCSDKCGPSTMTRNRKCIFKGNVTDDLTRWQRYRNVTNDIENRTCNALFCGNWNTWESSDCTGVCGVSGSYRKTRSCRLNGDVFVAGTDVLTTFRGLPEDCFQQNFPCKPLCKPT